jgi:predicted secreted protein with PEFG-CTERM motif
LEILALDDNDKVKYAQEIFVGTYGRLRDVVQGPDGSLYILTSNAGSGDMDNDKIILVVPEFGQLASLVLVISVLCIVVFSTKYGRLGSE